MTRISSPNNAVIILGMHRSGTSCLAGSLEDYGLHLGDVVTSAPHNKKGNRENREAMVLHESVLNSNGGAWNNPPDTCVWSGQQISQLDALIASYPTNDLWGIKDPRLLLVFDAWAERLNSPQLVGTIRHPTEVVQSLKSRQNEFIDDSILFELWHNYNQRLLLLWKKTAFPIVNFNSSPEEYSRQIQHVAKLLQLPKQKPSNTTFFEISLRKENANEREIPTHVEDLYLELQDASEQTIVLKNSSITQ